MDTYLQDTVLAVIIIITFALTKKLHRTPPKNSKAHIAKLFFQNFIFVFTLKSPCLKLVLSPSPVRGLAD